MKGEFEKRIRETFQGKILKAMYPDFDPDQEIKRIIDEARKEFPDVFYPEGIPHKGKVPWCNPEKAAKWFEKWISGGKPKK